MSLLASATYDPVTAVTKSTATLQAMTAMDITNLRLSFTVPPNGRVQARMAGVIHGAITFPQILIGIMEGAVIKGRAAPMAPLSGTALATTFQSFDTLIVVSGLVADASLSWDAAWSVETVVAATGIKYGGPNDALGNNAFGAFQFQIWSV